MNTNESETKVQDVTTMRETTSLFLSKDNLKTFINATLYSYSSEKFNGIDDLYLDYFIKIRKILTENLVISQTLNDIENYIEEIVNKLHKSDEETQKSNDLQINKERIKLCLQEEFLLSIHVKDIKINFEHLVITSRNKDDNSYIVKVSFNSNYVNELKTKTVKQLLEHLLLVKKN